MKVWKRYFAGWLKMKDRLFKRIRCVTVLSFLGVLVLIVSAICVRDPVILKLALSIGVTIFFISLVLLFSFFTKEKRNRLVMLLFSYFVPGILLFLGGIWLFILGIRLVIVGVMFIMGEYVDNHVFGYGGLPFNKGK